MTVSDQDLEEALGIAAKIIDLYGYTYWPIFERLETELEGRYIRRQKVEDRLRKKRSSQQHIAY
jgi:Txe/YoeB family toxin of Txe-Axe toxin-antitoxin module